MLDAALRFLDHEVRPNANEIDRDIEAMQNAFDKMATAGLLALKRPVEYGGPSMDESDFREFQEQIARSSGALAFLQTQHQSAGSLIAKHASPVFKQRILPGMHDGTITIGVGFSQLRRSGEPLVKAVKTSGGFMVTGHIPWITGFGIFQEYLLGATLPDGQSLFALLPLKSAVGHLISEPMRLAAMETCQTVTAELNNYFVSTDEVAFIKNPDWIAANDSFNIVLQGHFAIGCAMAGVDIVRDNFTKRGISFLKDIADALDREIAECRGGLILHQASKDTDQRLKARAWAIDLMMRCAHAGVTSSSGAANSIHHPAQRVFREAIVFTVSAQTQPIMQATLDRLVR
jgi:alkylation response protein AidB-like acyl-CoA dehydrogenase